MLRRKLFFAFMIIITVVVITISCTVYYVTYKQIYENAKSSYEIIFSQYASNISLLIETCKSYTLAFSSQNNVQMQLNKLMDQLENPSSQIGSVPNNTMLYPIEQSGYFSPSGSTSSRIGYNITVYAKNTNGLYYQVLNSNNQDPYISYANLPSVISKSIESKDGEFHIEINNSGKMPNIALSKLIYDNNDWDSSIGIVRCQISMDDLRTNFFSPLKLYYSVSTSLISSEDSLLIYDSIQNSKLIRSALSSKEPFIDGNYYVMTQSVNRGYFKLIGSLPIGTLVEKPFKSIRIIFVVTILALMFAFVASLIFSNSVIQPILSLSDTMKNVKDGNLDIVVCNNYTGEISELYDSFNYMIVMINQLIDHNYINQLKQKHSELNALQSQINTHFLYNTLDTVNWLAKDYKADDICLLVTSLSSLLRLSLNNGNEIISIRGELSHVNAYVDIQRIRFGNAFNVVIQADEEALDLSTLKMILQPLVENAIYHGLNGGINDNTIIVSINIEGNYVHERVINPGTNIDLIKMNTLTSPSKDIDYSQHYGVRSIFDRLNLNYGEEAKFYYTVDDGSTIAHIIFPATKML